MAVPPVQGSQGQPAEAQGFFGRNKSLIVEVALAALFPKAQPRAQEGRAMSGSWSLIASPPAGTMPVPMEMAGPQTAMPMLPLGPTTPAPITVRKPEHVPDPHFEKRHDEGWVY